MSPVFVQPAHLQDFCKLAQDLVIVSSLVHLESVLRGCAGGLDSGRSRDDSSLLIHTTSVGSGGWEEYCM